MNTGSISPRGAAALAGLLALLVSVPFCLPFHVYPDADFISQTSAFVLALAILLVGISCLPSLRVGLFDLGLLAFAALIYFAGDGVPAQIGFVVVLVAGLLGIVLRSTAALGSRTLLVDALMLGVMLGAFFNLLAGAIQLYGLEWAFPGYVFSDNRPDELNVVGNIAQRNLFCSYVFIGFLAFGLASLKRGVPLFVLAVLSFPVGLLLAASGSRSILLYLFWGVIASIVWFVCWGRRHPHGPRYLGFFILIALTFLASQWALGWLVPNAASGVERAAAGESIRPAEWSKAWQIIQYSFPGGVGWWQYAPNSFLVQLQGASQAAADNSWSHAHNIFLNLFAELGVAALLPIIVILALMRQIMATPSKGSSWLFLFVTFGVLFIHSNLEFPLWYVWGLYLFVSAAALVPAKSVTSYEPTVWMRGLMALIVVFALGLSVFSLDGFVRLARYTVPASDQQTNIQRLREMGKLAANPLLTHSSNLVSLSYLRPGESPLLFCRLVDLNYVLPGPELLDQMALEALLHGETEFALGVIRSRYRVYPGIDDKLLQRNLEVFLRDKDESLRGEIAQAKSGVFDFSKSYQLQIPQRCLNTREAALTAR